MFTSAVVAVLVTLSVVLTASVLFPHITGRQIVDVMAACGLVSLAAGAFALIRARRSHSSVEVDRRDRDTWRMPPLNMLSKPVMSTGRKLGLSALRSYLAIAMILVIVKIVQVAAH
jgi:hypothetical protein